MKIGILTFHRCVNNGAVMQSYSLCKRLQKELKNDTVEIIDYQMPCVDNFCAPTLTNYFKGCDFVLALKRFYRLLGNTRKFSQDKRRISVFQESMSKLTLSPEYIYDDGTEKLFKYIDENYDIVIAGSDAIWNYDVRGFPNGYFLSDTLKCKKFSYAASVYGMNYEKVPEETRLKIAKILDSYKLLCARDDESVKFAKAMGCIATPIHTCDPTVFLDVNDLPVDADEIKLKLKNKGFDFNKKTIGMMGSDAMCEMIRKLYGDKYQIVALFNYSKYADINLYDFSPFEWAYVFRFFKVTFTTFFHGTLVSLRNGTPVIDIALQNEYSETHMTKVEDFLIRIGMQDCYFKTDYRTQNLDAIKEKADYFLKNDLKQEIIEKMDNEAKTFDPFLEVLKKEIRN